MVQKGSDGEDCRLRIDPVLVDKFRRLPAGINEVGTKIVRDLGLKYQYDKHRGTLEIIGPDTEILALAAETLRFWVEDDEFPDTGITCQVGYPNRCIVIWRFHGDYAKKFDHLFADDIAKLKLITSVNIKAVPSKRNPEYIELYCHFSVYHQVKPEVIRISKEIRRIFQDDFFIPNSDFLKARNFARSKISDTKVLYALKEYPDNKVRVWLFARDQMDVIRARREWVQHVGIIARKNEFTETVRQDNSIKSASFFGHPASELESETPVPIQSPQTFTIFEDTGQQQSNKSQITQTSLNLSFKSRVQSQNSKSHKDISPRGPRIDNPNFPRPPDFIYPVQKEPLEQNVYEPEKSENATTNPFEGNALMLEGSLQGGIVDKSIPTVGDAKWVPEGETGIYRARKLSQPLQSRIYVHHQINDQQLQNNDQQHTETNNFRDIKNTRKQVVNPEKNLIEKERFNPTHHSRSVLTSVTDPRQAPRTKRGNKLVRQGQGAATKPAKVNAGRRQNRPVLKAQKQPTNIRYNINVNGLDIYMYKQDISKLDNMDALVNVSAPNLKDGDHIAKTIFAEAGKKVTDEIDIHLSLYGEAKMADNVVTSAGRLPTLGLIHVVSPIWQKYTVWQDCASDLHKALYDVLKTAESHKYRKIGIPTIGSEPFFGIPKDLVAEVYVKALIDYSMGMGPMYPVLEIHLVDTDHNMLTYIKDAYESWASTPGVADMTNHMTKEGEQIIKDPNEVSERSQSAVNLKSMPSHCSENMVTFTSQSYTKEGEQKWTFEVLKRLTVHVYTGSILKLEGVEAIVCAVDVNMQGTLAKNIQALAGKRYKTSLSSARSNRTLVEGDVLLCDAGALGVLKVLHSVISTPFRHISQKNLSRLDVINTQVFNAANKSRIKVLAMPLIGTGRLRERLEIEQCSLQLIDNIIEMCLSLGQEMTLQELHLVNTNHVMTQYLTQSLRTRAHTKLRIETGPHIPSRQEVLTKAEAIRRTPEKLSARSRKSNASGNKFFGVNTEINKKENENKTKTSNDKMSEGKNEYEHNKDTEKLNTKQKELKELKEINPDTDKSIVQTHDIGLNRDPRNDKRYNNKPKQTNHMPYLSQKNLETHNRLIRDGWEHLIDDKDNGKKSVKNHKKSEITKLQEELGHLDKETLIKRAQELLNQRKSEKTQKKNKRRIIQRSSDFIFQRSKADSYKTLFEKKQRYAEQTQKEEQLKLRKTQSSDDIWKREIADKVFETFKEERKKLSRQKKLAVKDNIDMAENERDEKDNYLNLTKKYFTRDTKNRYRQTSQGNGEEVYDEFERKNRIKVNDGIIDNDNKHSEKQSKTERSDRKSTYPVSKKTRSERHLIDTDREDQYMMDMEFLAKEREERERQKKEKPEATDTDGEEVGDRDVSKSEKSRKMRRDRLIALTSSENKNKEMDQDIASTEMNQLKSQSIQNDNDEHGERNTPNIQNNQSIISGIDASFEKELSAYSLKETEVQLPTSLHDNTNKKDSLMFEESIDKGNEAIQALTSGKTFKSYSVYSLKSKKDINDPFISKSEQYRRQGTGRVQFVQAYTDRPKEKHEIPKLTKTVNWKLGKKMTKESLYLFNEERRKATRAPRVDEVRVRDKLRLQINVVDQKTDNSDKIEEEKKKIRRFWEAVGGTEMKDEKEMFGEIDNKEKMLVAKVTKERIMSAKTKVSRQSKGSVVTHNVGDFNVTLEVGN